MPAPTTQTSARVFLCNAGDRMMGEVATQTEAVLRRLDRRFATIFFLEGSFEVFFVMIGNQPRATAASGVPNLEIIWTLATYSHLAAGVASKSVKLQRPARATVCSHSARDATTSAATMVARGGVSTQSRENCVNCHNGGLLQALPVYRK